MNHTQEPKMVSLSVGLPKALVYGQHQSMLTGIGKQKVEEVELSFARFFGDDVADKRNHGGGDRAVCFYPAEHYRTWEEELGRSLPNAAFGENITVAHLLEEDVHIGDTFEIGEAIIEISQGRVPCVTIDRHVQTDKLLKRMIETGYTGFFGRVLQPGMIRADSPIKKRYQHPARISILHCNRVYYENKDVEAMTDILKVDELSNEWRERITERVERLKKG